MIPFIFCPACGKKSLQKHDGKSVRCPCGFLYYQNVASAVACIIETPRGLLLTRRNKEPKKGMLDLPGGFVDYGESLEKALTREIKEELGVKLHAFSYFCTFPSVYPYKGIKYHTADSFFLAKLSQVPTFRFDDEIKGVVIQKPEKIHLHDIGFISARKAITYYRSHYPSFPAII